MCVGLGISAWVSVCSWCVGIRVRSDGSHSERFSLVGVFIGYWAFSLLVVYSSQWADRV